jgi:hypothetical protein
MRAEQRRKVAEEAREFQQLNKDRKLAAQRAQVCVRVPARCC